MVEKYRLFTGLFFGALWIALCFGFVAEEFIPPLLPLRSFVMLFCDIVFLILGLFSLRDRRDLIVFFSFVLIGGVSSVLNGLGPVFIINGARDFFGILFAIPICRMLLKSHYRDRFVSSFDRQLKIFLVLQAICLTWQFIRYGANDHGGGTMGFGYSGIVSTLIYITSFYLLSKYWTFGNYWVNMGKYKVYFILLYPTFLNETKISFIFLLAYFLLLLPIEWKTVFKIMVSIPLIVFFLLFAGYSYLVITGQVVEGVFSEEAMNDYMIGEDPEELLELVEALQDDVYDKEDVGMLDIPRFTKLFVMPDAVMDSQGGLLLGAGLGQFKGGSVLDYTPFAERWTYLLSGSIVGALIIFIQMGLLGFVWFLYNMVSVLIPRSPLLLGNNIKLYVALILSLVMFYNDALRFFPFCFIIFYIVLRGYVGVKEPVKSKTEGIEC